MNGLYHARNRPEKKAAPLPKPPCRLDAVRGSAKQTLPGQPTNACLDAFVFAAFFSKTGKVAFGNSA
jgi:hypothetical protein